MSAAEKTTDYMRRTAALVERKVTAFAGRPSVAMETRVIVPIMAACVPLLVWTYSLAQEHALTKQLTEQNTVQISNHAGRIRIVEQSAAVTIANIETFAESMRQIAYDVREMRKAQEANR